MEVSVAPSTIPEAMDELLARFLNLPRSEAITVPRIFFLIQQAHWYYVDEMVDNDTTGGITHLGFYDFSLMMLESSPMLREYSSSHEEFKAEFKAYSGRIPKYGVMMLNASATHMLLVAGYGAKASYSSPKGKVNEGEVGIDCAAREAFEETGYNPRHLMREELSIVRGDEAKGDFMKLYIAVGVPDDGSVEFSPTVKREIGSITWVEIASCEGGSGMAVASDGTSKRVKTWNVSQFLPEMTRLLGQRGNGGGESGGGSKGGKGGKGKVGKRAGQHPAPTRMAAQPGGPDELPNSGGWSVSDMFAANERILGTGFTYTGNAHEFGSEGPSGLGLGIPDFKKGKASTSKQGGRAVAVTPGQPGQGRALPPMPDLSGPFRFDRATLQLALAL
jgi:ADP-ribose pyrophosphatase YjhB (NUDIX family)